MSVVIVISQTVLYVLSIVVVNGANAKKDLKKAVMEAGSIAQTVLLDVVEKREDIRALVTITNNEMDAKGFVDIIS